jgi:hypothetical protein
MLHEDLACEDLAYDDLAGDDLAGERLPYRVICTNGPDEVLVRAASPRIGRAAYETAIRLFPKDRIQYRNGAQIIARSDPGNVLV